jgi:cytochrome P450
VFSHRHIAAFAPDIVAAARARAARWPTGSVIDVAAEMRTLTMDVVGRVLFGTDLAGEAESVGAAVSRLQTAATVAVLIPSGRSPERSRAIVSRVVPGLGRSIGTLDGLVERVIAERLAAPRAEQRDLLDLLIAAGEGTDGLSRTEIRDEVMTLVLAGHETTANTLTWTLTLLSQYPAARERLEAEVDEVLAGRDAAADDADKLVWTRAVISEAMRLYPPAWTIERDAAVDDEVAGVPVPEGNTVAISPYLLHRHPEFWPNPEGFDPARFLPERAEGRPKYAFLPFGGGRRICVGAGFAQLEAVLALATLAGSHRLDLVPNAAVVPQAGVTIHPRGALPMTVRAR